MRHTNLLASIMTAAGLLATPLWCAGFDNGFVQKAAEGGAAEVQMAQLAQSKASSQAVKDLANKLVADHTKANDNLKPLATKDNITWPTGLSAKDQAEYNKLQALSGAEFDREYAKMMLSDHRKDVSEFEKQSTRGGDADLKAFATKTLPTLKEHLQMAESLPGAKATGNMNKP